MDKKAVFAINPIDVIAGVLLVVAGIVLIIGKINLATVFAGIGLLIEAVKVLLKQGF